MAEVSSKCVVRGARHAWLEGGTLRARLQAWGAWTTHDRHLRTRRSRLHVPNRALGLGLKSAGRELMCTGRTMLARAHPDQPWCAAPCARHAHASVPEDGEQDSPRRSGSGGEATWGVFDPQQYGLAQNVPSWGWPIVVVGLILSLVVWLGLQAIQVMIQVYVVGLAMAGKCTSTLKG